MIDGLIGMKDSDGKSVLVCDECRALPENAYGAHNKDQAAYILRCASCGKILGEWTTLRARDAELQEFSRGEVTRKRK